MKKNMVSLAACSILAMTGGGNGWAEDPRQMAEADIHAQCQALANADLSPVADAPTQVISAVPVAAQKGLPAYCRIEGYVAPRVGIKLGLPSLWNGKLIEAGCAGHCGVVESGFSWGCEPALRKGYACIASDMGHTGTGGLWGKDNLQGKVDWGYRSTHVTALAGKAMTERFYGSAPRKSYFLGGSTGGRQALQEAQRFPWDFDGIVAIQPPTDLATNYVTFAWGIRAMHDVDGNPLLGDTQLKLLTNAAIAKCDLDDGVKDGIIGDPLHCPFDPTELTCAGKRTTDCLTPVQVNAATRVYAGPMTSSGVPLSLGGPAFGSELGENVVDWRFYYVGHDGEPAPTEEVTRDGLRYLFFASDPGPRWTIREFDFDHDYQRLRELQVLYESGNPDLRKFKAAGGKLLIFAGLNDVAIPPRSTIDYYETVERTMGGPAGTHSFARLFLLPGIGHGGSGDVGAGLVDVLTALEEWVEEGKAPDRLIAAHLKNGRQAFSLDFPLDPHEIQFTRPLFPYPVRAKYRGHGDPNAAASFVPTAR